MNPALDLQTVHHFAIALLIGVLIGIEREKRKSEPGSAAFGGIRTFALLAELGAVAAWISMSLNSPWVFAVAVFSVSLIVLGSYVLQGQSTASFGLTSEFAAIVTCLLGGVAVLGFPALAVGLGVTTSALLAYKQPLHGLISEMGWDDIFAGLRLLIASFIVLPLLPNEALDPLNALNPYRLWFLVILISSLSLVGYIAVRWLGSKRGIMLTGLTGGLVSSTAVTLAFSKDARDAKRSGSEFALTSGILLAWAVMFGRVLVEVAIVNRPFIVSVFLPIVTMGGVALAFALVFARRSSSAALQQDAKSDQMKLENPFSLTEAGKFAVLFAVVLVLVKLAQQYFPASGIYLVAALAGLTDMDAITLSMAEHAKGGDVDGAAMAIVIAAVSNTAVKCGFVSVIGGASMRRLILPATIATLIAGFVTILAF